MKRLISLLTLFLLVGSFLSVANSSKAQDNNPSNTEIIIFYSTTCPHCEAERQFLSQLKQKYPQIEIKEYEVIYNQDNQKLLADYYKQYNVPNNEQGYVPVTFTAKKYFIGFSDAIGKEIENCLQQCMGQGGSSEGYKINLPFFGEVDLTKFSLPVLTIVLGTLDGFNPCAMWILVVLVSLLVAQKSRKKLLIVGGTFVLAEGLLYFLIMSAWLNAFFAIGYVYLVRILIGAFGIVFGALRIKDFINWQPGVCKVVDNPQSQKKTIDKISSALNKATIPATIIAMAGLAFSVNIIEFFCSAGFPTIFTRILSLQNIGNLQYYLYLIVYNIFYMIDDLVVFAVAFFTLGHFNFSDRYNRWSTLIAGVLILLLGILLIVKPGLLMFA